MIVDPYERLEFIFTRDHKSGNMIQTSQTQTGSIHSQTHILTDDEANMLGESISDVLSIIEKTRERKRRDAEQDGNQLDGQDEQPDTLQPPGPPSGD